MVKLTQKQIELLKVIKSNVQYSKGTLKPNLRTANALVLKGLMKKFENNYGIEVWVKEAA